MGGKELAGVEAAVSDEFIGANIKIIGIRFGVISVSYTHLDVYKRQI